MKSWLLPEDVQHAASEWRDYRSSSQSDLAGTVNAAHLLASHTMYPLLLEEDMVVEDPVFEQLGIFPGDRRLLIAKRDQVISLAGM